MVLRHDYQPIHEPLKSYFVVSADYKFFIFKVYPVRFLSEEEFSVHIYAALVPQYEPPPHVSFKSFDPKVSVSLVDSCDIKVLEFFRNVFNTLVGLLVIVKIEFSSVRHHLRLLPE